MRVNEIVTSFLKFGNEILILRRSESVCTYKWRWGGISGFMEENENPLGRVVKEIKEEAGLEEGDFELLKEGRAFSFEDEYKEAKIKWKVHPFLFKVKTKKIKINKEHFEFKWINPEELWKYLTVPKLEKSLERVL